VLSIHTYASATASNGLQFPNTGLGPATGAAQRTALMITRKTVGWK
jgi:hypothetical protein